MGGKKNPAKEAAAAEKATAKSRESASREEAEWSKGSKDNSKKQAAADKAAEAARKKAEKDALLKEEEAALPTKVPKGNAKKAEKKTRGTLDLGQLDDAGASSSKETALNARGIDNALDALSLTGGSNANDLVDRHPERRFKAAYTAFETWRLEEMAGEKGLRRNQKVEQIRKEFERHPDNPFNQVAGKHNSTRDELREIAEQEKRKVEDRLASP